jgi:DNA modification methylase/DNA-directed RNA polymerase subunit RPC12/RpoP
MLNNVLRVKRSDPIYNAHSYLTKVPVGAIIPFIEEYSPVGGLVVDMFAGSGMTAIASKMTNRNALVSDISVLGRHIGLGYLSSVEPEKLHKIASEVVSDSKAKCGHNYRTIRSEDDQIVDFGKTIWSFVYECAHCKNELVYYELLKSNSFKTSGLSCPQCNSEFQKRGATYLKDIPVIVSVNGVNGKQVEQAIQKYDFDLIRKAETSDIFDHFPSIQIPKDREMYKRSALEKWDLTETKKFFSYRNAIVLDDLWKRINAVKNENLRQKLRFTFTAILPRASRRYQWSIKAPLNAAIQNYYIAPVYYEWNVYDLFLRKINAVAKAEGVIAESAEQLTTTQNYVNASADELPHLENESVDFIFTDPPFGSNIFYSDMNLFHEAWIGERTDNSREAVMKTTGKNKQQSKDDYQEVLTGAFSEAWRTLKEGAYLAVVFGNSQGSIWSVVQQSIYNAGFVSKPEKILILDKGQRSVKGLNSGTEKVATLDLIVVIKKNSNADMTPITLSDDYKETINKTMDNIELSPTLTASHIYLEVLRTAMSDHVCMADLDLHDILTEIENRGFSVDPQSGYLVNK